MNRSWHEHHVLGSKARLDDRVTWHLAHAQACACRPIPASVAAEIAARGVGSDASGNHGTSHPVAASSVVDLAKALAAFTEPWQPRTVAVMNDYDVRVVKTLGEFTPHSHPDTDELFLVISGSLTIRMNAGDVTLGPGQLFVVPRGVLHQPVSSDGAEVVLIEPSITVNTGDTPSTFTAARRTA